MRELSTRYGRDNIGFLWVIVEHLIFAGGVALLWVVIRPPFEHGIRIIPFVITGYLPLILIRQTVSFAVTGVSVNSELLYHRQITPLHILLTRCAIEVTGVSLAFVTIVSLLMLVGVIPPFEDFNDLGYVYAGWFILAWMTVGLALILAALAEIFDFVERFVQIFTYLLIPLSGAYTMVSWLPGWVRPYMLAIPFVHCFEMIRRGFFGEFVPTYFDPLYAIAWAAIFNFFGLILTQFVRDRVDVF
jgi:capsular polysaccharide transport system permease protein